MADTPKKKVYVVREVRPENEWTLDVTIVWSFADRAEAEACRRRLLGGCLHNPFRRGHGNKWPSSRSEQEFRELVQSLGLKLPTKKKVDWADWWDSAVRDSPAIESIKGEPLAQLWYALDQAEVYCIHEEEIPVGVEPEGVADARVYAVQEFLWAYNDEWHDLDDDRPTKAFRSREKAEAYCRRLERQRREEYTAPYFAGARHDAMTSLPWDEFLKALHQLKLKPPPPADLLDPEGPEDADSMAWWGRLQFQNPEMFHRVWDLFDRVCFYRVAPLDLGVRRGEPL